MDVEFWLDGGAYATLSAVVLSRGSLHASGPYECPNVRIRSRALATSHPPHGAFRGFGAPQSLFAIERHMDVVAKACGLTPQELRQRNVLRRGSTTASGQKIKEDVALDVLMRMAHEDIRFDERAREYAAHNASSAGLRTRKGIGAATFFHGAGFTGSGEKNLASVAAVNIAPCGSLRILVASTEMGQGAHTILAQMAADAAGTEVDVAFVATPDTAHVPDSGPTVASRTTMIVGGLVEKAARALRAELDAGGFLSAGTHADADSFRKAALAAAAQRNVAPEALRQECQYVPPSGLIWDDKTYRGDAYPTFAWACYAAAVSVDLLTYEVTVEAFSAVQDIGKVINPLFAAGQVEGGVVQAIGYALSEKVAWKNGVMSNARLTNYIIPTALDVPRISVRFFEHPKGTPEAQTPKGIGELPMDGVAPALAGALEDALGVSFTRIPILPEDIFQALQAKGNTP
jgi:CO/xanthine dehydrogenase Mo-binding subunit